MANVQEWQTLANKELSRREKIVESLERQTAEGIAIKPLYTEADLDNLEVTGTLPGLPPYVRGPRATMYTRSRGPFASTLVSLPPKSPTPFTAATSPPGKKDFPSPLTLPPIAAMTLTTRAWQVTSAKRAWRSILSKI